MSYRRPYSLTSGSPLEGMPSPYLKMIVVCIVFGGEGEDKLKVLH